MGSFKGGYLLIIKWLENYTFFHKKIILIKMPTTKWLQIRLISPFFKPVKGMLKKHASYRIIDNFLQKI